MTDFDQELRDRRERADARLWTALMEHADAYQLTDDGELLNHFGIVCHWSKAESDGNSRYTTQFHTAEVPVHIAEGLFSTALRLVQSREANENREE